MSPRSLEDAHQFASILSPAQKSFVVTILQLKKERWFLILIGQWGNTCRVTNLFSFTVEHSILLSCVSCPYCLDLTCFAYDTAVRRSFLVLIC